MEILAPAKINLSLDITGRRPDGYHTLRMVMQSISLYDRISVSKTQTGAIEVCCNDLNVPCGPENTIRRAAEAFFKIAGITCNYGVVFHIDKKIPEQAGLGGGSADAAAALKLLNQFYQTNFSIRQLQKIGLTVGADVPFCVQGGTALAEGIGESLTPLKPLPLCHIVVCKPQVGINTKEAYHSFDMADCAPTHFTDKMLAALNSGKLNDIGKNLGNGFESIGIPQDVWKIEQIMHLTGAVGACMTGSGSAVFGLFDDLQKASSCQKSLAVEYQNTFLCRPVSEDN